MSPLFLVGRESSDRRLTGAARSVLRNLLRQKRYNGARFYNYNVRNVNKKLSNRASKFIGSLVGNESTYILAIIEIGQCKIESR